MFPALANSELNTEGNVIGGLISSLSHSQAMNQFQMRAMFQQLGTDLHSGNVAAAEKDFASLTQNSSIPETARSSARSQAPVAQQIQQLGQDLRLGNLSAAQEDYSAIQRSLHQRTQPHPGPGGPDACPATSGDATAGKNDPVRLLKNLATTAAATYGGVGLTGALTVGSMVSALL